MNLILANCLIEVERCFFSDSSNGMHGAQVYKAVVSSKGVPRKLSKEAMRENLLKDASRKTFNNNNTKKVKRQLIVILQLLDMCRTSVV